MFLDKVRGTALRVVRDPAERLFRKLEQSEMSRGASLKHIPFPKDRGGGLGTTTYAEWCYTVGLFQTLIFMNLPKRPLKVLDVGCGVGRLLVAAKPYLMDEDRYVGIDVTRSSIEIARRHYQMPNAEFIHVDASNGYYNRMDSDRQTAWPFGADEYNLVTGLSVWTHLSETDWKFYLKEVGRVLAPGGRAIISFFVLDEHYRPEQKTERVSRFYPQPENKWVFDSPAYGSTNWRCPSWASVPEVAIATTKQDLESVSSHAGLSISNYYPGQWKDIPGFFFQDVCVFEKKA